MLKAIEIQGAWLLNVPEAICDVPVSALGLFTHEPEPALSGTLAFRARRFGR
jgi:hypothetical protein